MSGPSEVTVHIAARVRQLRRARNWSAERLAAEVNKQGIDWKRGVVTKLETGHREAVTVDELLALGHVLDVSVLSLLPGAEPCRVCDDAPPPGFTCQTCLMRG